MIRQANLSDPVRRRHDPAGLDLYSGKQCRGLAGVVVERASGMDLRAMCLLFGLEKFDADSR
jgi:hypothetical protein